MHIREFVVFLAAISFLVCPADAGSNKAINIAVVADRAFDLDQSHLVSILEVELSQTEGIQVLERTQIDKILQEQQLSLTGRLDRNAIVKAGQLLRADAFVLLSQESSSVEARPTRRQPVDEFGEDLPKQDNSPKGNLIRIRVAETAHGLRLSDKFEELDNSKLEQTAKRIVKEIIAVADKLNLPTGQAIPIGIVDIHRVQLGERYKLLERALPVLLSVRLSKEPKIIMLEREDLKVLLDEKLLTEGHDSEFWTSAVLIDGYLQPKDGGLEMTLQLRQSEGKEIVTVNVPVEPNEPSLAIDIAANEIIKQIQDSPPSTQWNPAKEAEEFYKQGQLLSAHSRYEDAIIPFETAHALQPQNVFYTGAIFTNEWNAREKVNAYLYPEVYYSDNELAEIVSLLVRQIQIEYERGSLSERNIPDRWVRQLGIQMNVRSYFTTPHSVSTNKIKLINCENRKIWVETLSKAYKKRPLRRNSPGMHEMLKAHLAWIESDDPNEIIANLKQIFTKCCMPPELGGIFESVKDRNNFYHRAFRIPIGNGLEYTDRTHLGDECAIFLRLWWEFLSELTQVNDPVVKLNAFIDLGRSNICECNRMLNKDNRDKADYYISEALKIITDRFQWSNESYILYQVENIKLINDSIKNMDVEFEKKISIWENIFEPLIAEGNAVDLSLWNPSFLVFGTGKVTFPSDLNEAIKRYYLLLERSAIVLQSSKGDSRITKALNNIRDAQSEIRSRYSQIAPANKQLNLSVDILLTQDDFLNKLDQWRRSIMPILFKSEDNTFWVAMKEHPTYYNSIVRTNIGLASIDLGEKKLTSLWHAKFSYIHTGFVELTGIISFGEKTYLSVKNVGIVEFPGRNIKGHILLQDPKILTQEDGLPSISITSVHFEDKNKIWIAYGDYGSESGLGLYEPETGSFETFLCSSIKDKSIFSEGLPYQIYSLMREPPDKLFFFAYDLDKSGLWKMNIKSRDLQYLGPVWTAHHYGWDMFIESAGQKMFFKTVPYLLEFDAYSEKIKFVVGNKRDLINRYRSKNIPLSIFWDDLFVSNHVPQNLEFSVYYIGSCDLSTAAIHNDHLWARLGKSQIIIVEKDKSFEEAEIIDNNILDGEPVERFVSTPYGLVAIGNGIVGLIDTE